MDIKKIKAADSFRRCRICGEETSDIKCSRCPQCGSYMYLISAYYTPVGGKKNKKIAQPVDGCASKECSHE